MSVVKRPLALESHPDCDHHYVFSAECIDRIAGQAMGLPVTINFRGDPVGTVTAVERTTGGVLLEIEIRDLLVEQDAIASPAFVATDVEWNSDYSERVIRVANLKGIGLTDG